MIPTGIMDTEWQVFDARTCVIRTSDTRESADLV